MYPFKKQITEIALADLLKLCTDKIAESENLEFKQDLAFSEGGADWQNRLSNDKDAKVKLAKELIAFANSSGGTLLLGVVENDENRASSLKPIQSADDLKDRLVQILGEIIEPPIRTIQAAVVPTGNQSEGVIVFQVEKSLDRPHRVNMKRSKNSRYTEAYTRRGTNSEPMTMLEIQQLSVLRNSEISLVKSQFENMLNDMTAEPVKRPAEYKYSFFACPVMPMSVNFPSSNSYSYSNVKLVSDKDVVVGKQIDLRVSWFQADKILGGRSHRTNFGDDSYIRYWWMKDGSFRYFCNESMKSDGSQQVNPHILFAPLCYLAQWIGDLQSFDENVSTARMACGFVLDNSNNLPLGSYRDGFSSLISTPNYSPINLSEIYEFSGVGELEQVANALAQDLFNAFNADFDFGELRFENL